MSVIPSEARDLLIARIQAAAAGGTPLRIRGGGTKDFYGGPLSGDVLDTREHAGIVAYEPTELYVTARCGTPVADLERARVRVDEVEHRLRAALAHGACGKRPASFAAARSMLACACSSLQQRRRSPSRPARRV